ncbi:MAG: O-methyltransferase [Chloroflexota bacterium]|jgi:O-methyltransferase|nr:O-methyltransferase [Chloroflexota bacterium]
MSQLQQSASELYLDLLKGCLTRTLFETTSAAASSTRMRRAWGEVAKRLRPRLVPVYTAALKRVPQDSATARAVMPSVHRGLHRLASAGADASAEGRTWPAEAETMIGLARLDNLQACIETIIRDEIPGDLLEAGVWRGGATILMRGALAAYGDQQRSVWAADSFAGLPKPRPDEYQEDAGDQQWALSELAVALDEVKRNFDRYGLLDDRVKFLPGWFHKTLPNAPIESLSLLRLDGDMYESTIVTLEALYPRLSPGGFVIVDDYGALLPCRAAVDDYRRAHDVDEPIQQIDWSGIFWRRSPGAASASVARSSTGQAT